MDKSLPPSPVSFPPLARVSHRFALEPRLMYDAAGLISGLEGVQHGDANHHPAAEDHGVDVGREGFNHVPTNAVVFVDSRVEDYQSLLGRVTPSTRIVMLDSQRDGVEQISSVLAEYRGLDSVHIISHGGAGILQLGSQQVTGETLENHAQQVQQWSNALSQQADVLIYGCNVAAGEKGQAFVDRLGQLTGADVAASNDATGSDAHNADWDLEYHHGRITTDLVADESQQHDYQHVLTLSTLGTETRVNTFTTASQSGVAAAELTGGGHAVVWESNGQDGSYKGIYLQLFSETGEKVATEVQVNTITALDQSSPAVSALQDGGFVVTWQSNGQNSTDYNIYAQRFDASGTMMGGEILVNTTTANDQTTPTITTLEGGKFMVTWQSVGQEGSNYGIYGRLFNADGTAATDEMHINTTTASSQWNPSVSALQDGGFVVVWQSDTNASSQYDVMGQRFNASGSAVGSEFLVADESQWQVSVAGLDSGGFVVTWNSASASDADPSSEGVFAKIYDQSGNVVKNDFLVNTYSTGNQQYSSVSALPYGGFVVTWASQSQDTSGYGIYAQRFDTSGNKDGEEFLVNATTNSDQDSPVVTTHGSGFFVLWQSLDQDGNNYGIYGQHYGLNNPPVLDNSGNFSAGVSYQGIPVGISIGSLLGNSVTDPDLDAKKGIAITGVDTENGSWQFSLDGGITWQEISQASETSAIFLAVDGRTQLRFVADEIGFTGTAAMTFKAWDQNFGANGQRGDLTNDNGRIATSVATGTARATVNPLPPPQILPDSNGGASAGGDSSSSQTSDSLAKFMQSLTQSGQTQVSNLSQEQIMKMYQEYLTKNGLSPDGLLPPSPEHGPASAEGQLAEAGRGAAAAQANEGVRGEVQQVNKGGDLAVLGATLSKQLEGQTHRTVAERQELAKVLHEIQGLLSCN